MLSFIIITIALFLKEIILILILIYWMKRVILLIGITCLFFCYANEDDDLLLGLEIMKEEDAINIKFKP